MRKSQAATICLEIVSERFNKKGIKMVHNLKKYTNYRMNYAALWIRVSLKAGTKVAVMQLWIECQVLSSGCPSNNLKPNLGCLQHFFIV